MSHSHEKQLQDYLDGRLGDEERARFEEILERDPELAARLEESREIRNALRQGDEDLSPGFYTRARSRFEDSVRPRRRVWFRWLSWESAGLAAAVILAAVLFVPGWMRDDLQTLVAPVEDSLETKKKAEPAVLQTGLGAAGGEGAVGGAEKNESVAAEGSELVDEFGEQDRADEPAPVDSGFADKAGKDEELAFAQSPPPAPTLKRQAPAKRPAAPRQAAEEERSEERRFAPAPRPDGVEAEPEKKGRERSQAEDDTQPARAKEAQGFQTTSQALAEPDGDRATDREDLSDGTRGSSRTVTTTVPLAPGLVGPGEVRVVETREEWEELLRGPAGEVLSRLGGFDPRRRLVLIGSRSAPLDCDRTTVDQVGETLVIRLSTAQDGRGGSVHGCALALPREGSFVVVEPQLPLD